MYHNLHRKQYLFMKNFRMPLRFYSWCSAQSTHGNLAISLGVTVNYFLQDESQYMLSESEAIYKKLRGTAGKGRLLCSNAI